VCVFVCLQGYNVFKHAMYVSLYDCMTHNITLSVYILYSQTMNPLSRSSRILQLSLSRNAELNHALDDPAVDEIVANVYLNNTTDLDISVSDFNISSRLCSSPTSSQPPSCDLETNEPSVFHELAPATVSQSSSWPSLISGDKEASASSQTEPAPTPKSPSGTIPITVDNPLGSSLSAAVSTMGPQQSPSGTVPISVDNPLGSSLSAAVSNPTHIFRSLILRHN